MSRYSYFLHYIGNIIQHKSIVKNCLQNFNDDDKYKYLTLIPDNKKYKEILKNKN